jgi:hypothetical protein
MHILKLLLPVFRGENLLVLFIAFDISFQHMLLLHIIEHILHHILASGYFLEDIQLPLPRQLPFPEVVFYCKCLISKQKLLTILGSRLLSLLALGRWIYDILWPKAMI